MENTIFSQHDKNSIFSLAALPQENNGSFYYVHDNIIHISLKQNNILLKIRTEMRIYHKQNISPKTKQNKL